MMAWLVVLLLALAATFFVFSAQPELAMSLFNVEVGAIVLALALAIYVAIILTTERLQVSTTLRHLSIWGVLMLLLVAGYSYRDELSMVAHRVAGDLMPPGVGMTVETGVPGERAVRIRRRVDGHFTATATVNGAPMTLMVDTGASTVVLKPADAAKAGVDVDALTYGVAVSTANGTTYAAPVRLRMLSIGPIEIGDIDALVAKPGTLNESLLGMSFLRKLRSFDFSGEFLTLRG